MAKVQSRCKVCSHPKLKQIERALVLRAQPIRVIAEAHGISPYSVERHYHNHVTAEQRRLVYADARSEQAMVDRATADQIVKADRIDVMGSLARLSKRCERILDSAEKDGEDGLALSAIRELRHQITLAAKILGDLDSTKETTVIIADHPAWLSIRDLIFRVLDRHPDAKRDFIESVKGLGNGQQRLVS